jgi:hypothetical protein
MIATGGTVPAVDNHGNAEDVEYIGCRVYGGYGLGGNGIKVLGGFVRGAGNLTCFSLSELVGLDVTIDSVMMESNARDMSRGVFVDVGGNSTGAFDGATSFGGSLRITNNDFVYTRNDNTFQPWITVVNRGYVGNQYTGVRIEGNQVRAAGRMGGASVVNISGTAFHDVVYNDNETNGASGLRCTGTTIAYQSTRRAYITDNITVGGWLGAVFVDEAIDLVVYHNNTSQNNRNCSQLGGVAGARTRLVSVKDIVSLDDLTSTSGSTNTDNAITFFNISTLIVGDTAIGGLNQRVRLASSTGFAAGDTVTFRNLGVVVATAVIGDIVGNDLQLGRTLTAAVSIGNTVTGALGGSSTVTAASPTLSNTVCYLSDITTLHRGQNVATDGLTQRLVGGAVGSDNPL